MVPELFCIMLFQSVRSNAAKTLLVALYDRFEPSADPMHSPKLTHKNPRVVNRGRLDIGSGYL